MQIAKHSKGLALTLLWRDWKSGELNILLASLLLAIATVTSISLFTSRIHNSIYTEAATFLAADATVSGTQEIPEEWSEKANTLSLNTSTVTNFRAMAFSEAGMTLTQVKAVDQHYPLLGNLEISDKPFTSSDRVSNGPKPGTAWLAPRLFGALKVNKGDTISIGDADFIVEASLNREPDSGQSLFGVSPRVMIHRDDLAATNAVQVGSRVSYSLLIAGKKNTIEEYKNWINKKLGNHFSWTGVEGSNRAVGGALNRAERFLLLTGCLSVVLSGVAIALASRRYAQRQNNNVAILKTLGLGPRNIVFIYIWHLALIGISALALGGLLGWALHLGILRALGDLIPTSLSAASWAAYTTGGITGIVSLWAFAAPPIMSLRHVAPASILRDEKASGFSQRISAVIGVIAVVFLMLLYSQDIALTAIVSLGASACIVGVGTLGTLLIHVSKKLGTHLNYQWRLGLANLQRHQRFNALQIMIFSVLLMLLFILLTVRTTLINQWQSQLPDDAPNHFAFNIFPSDIPKIDSFFKDHAITAQPFYPMTRGRLVEVNGEDAKPIIENKTNNLNYKRELNLTWSNTYGSDNSIIDGKWWSDSSSTELLVSAEEEYAKGIGLDIGDTVTFSVAGANVTAKVSNIRSVQWDSMNPNFFMIFNRAINEGASANWITSFYLPSDKKPLLNILSREHPTISLIEIDQTIQQIQSIIQKVSMAIEFILILVLASGALVLITSIQATLDVRVMESAIFRTLGAKKALIRKVLLIEFGMLGFLAGVLAVIGTEACMYFLQTRVFDLAYQAQFHMWLWGPALATCLIGVIGWASTRNVVVTPPLQVLRQQG